MSMNNKLKVLYNPYSHFIMVLQQRSNPVYMLKQNSDSITKIFQMQGITTNIDSQIKLSCHIHFMSAFVTKMLESILNFVHCKKLYLPLLLKHKLLHRVQIQHQINISVDLPPKHCLGPARKIPHEDCYLT